jgi:hypothetical protein
LAEIDPPKPVSNEANSAIYRFTLPRGAVLLLTIDPN